MNYELKNALIALARTSHRETIGSKANSPYSVPVYKSVVSVVGMIKGAIIRYDISLAPYQ